MKKALFLLLFLFSYISHAQTAQELENITAFNRLYGYVKYFHPSDEAAAIDWNKFAIYGSKEVLKCKDATCLQQTLVGLFEPIAPTIQIVQKGREKPFSQKTITPPDTTGYKVVTWQHQGLGNGVPENVYQSGRTNRMVRPQPTFSTITASMGLEQYRNRPFVFSANVRLVDGPGTAHLWARVDRSDRKMGFFDNMENRPITSPEWTSYQVEGAIADDAVNLAFGCFLKGEGKLVVDNLVLKINTGSEWKTVYTNSFESDALNVFPASISGSRLPDYTTQVTSEEANEGKQSVTIKSTEHFTPYKPLFTRHCQPGEYIHKDLGAGLSAVVPLALYGTTTHTWPAGDKEKISELKKNLEEVPTTPEDIVVRAGGIVIAWNVFQHFYPYFDLVKGDWETAFNAAIQESFDDRSSADYLRTLRRLTAKLKDGHANVYSAGVMANEGFAPPVNWEWIENKLVVTKVVGDSLTIKPGDIVTTINDLPAPKFFEEIYAGISAATPGWRDYRANSSSLFGPQNSTLILKLLDAQNKERQVSLRRTLNLRDFYQLSQTENDPIRTLGKGIHYINLSKASMQQIREKFTDLETAKGIICDLRGYPNSNHEIISHLLNANDTSRRWMRVPQLIYPDQQNIAGYARWAGR